MKRATGFFFLASMGIAGAADPLPEFEAASVRVNRSLSEGSSSRWTQGQLMMTNQSLRRLIERAYLVQPFQVAGPSWMDSARFDVVAKFPSNTEPANGLLMLQALLEDRFRLRVHRESKETSGYALVAGKGGFRLTPVEPGSEEMNSEGGVVRTMTAKSVSMSDMAKWMSRTLGQPVVDKSGAKGVYDLTLRWTSDDLKNDADAAPPLFTAIEQTLGLRLRPERVSVEVIAVDSAEQTPTEN